jgi:hypothetical protein
MLAVFVTGLCGWLDGNVARAGVMCTIEQLSDKQGGERSA